MSDPLSREDEYLFKELEQASRLTFHVDELRNKLTSFWLTFVGIAVTGLSIMAKSENTSSVIPLAADTIAIILVVIGFIGGVIIAIMGRLRKVQIEHFGIINSIREYFLPEESGLMDVVKLSSKTLPKPNHKSGTFFWVLILMLTNACLWGIAALLLFDILLVAVGVFIASGILFERIYFLMAAASVKEIKTAPEEQTAGAA